LHAPRSGRMPGGACKHAPYPPSWRGEPRQPPAGCASTHLFRGSLWCAEAHPAFGNLNDFPCRAFPASRRVRACTHRGRAVCRAVRASTHPTRRHGGVNPAAFPTDQTPPRSRRTARSKGTCPHAPPPGRVPTNQAAPDRRLGRVRLRPSGGLARPEPGRSTSRGPLASALARFWQRPGGASTGSPAGRAGAPCFGRLRLWCLHRWRISLPGSRPGRTRRRTGDTLARAGVAASDCRGLRGRGA
jgi:hypothetical protein